MQNSAGEGGEGVRSVARALDLLALFDDAHRSRSMRELIDGTGLAKSTVVPKSAVKASRAQAMQKGVPSGKSAGRARKS